MSTKQPLSGKRALFRGVLIVGLIFALLTYGGLQLKNYTEQAMAENASAGNGQTDTQRLDKTELAFGEGALRLAIGAARHEEGPYTTSQLNMLEELEKLYKKHGETEKRIETLKAALEVAEHHYPEDSKHVSKWALKLGYAYQDAQQYQASFDIFSRVLPAYEKEYGRFHAETNWINMELGWNLKEQEVFDKAIPYFEAAVAGYEHEGTLLTRDQAYWSIASLGECYLQTEQYAKAEQAIRKTQEHLDYQQTHQTAKSSSERFDGYYNMLNQMYLFTALFSQPQKRAEAIAQGELLKRHLDRFYDEYPSDRLDGYLLLTEGYLTMAQYDKAQAMATETEQLIQEGLARYKGPVEPGSWEEEALDSIHVAQEDLKTLKSQFPGAAKVARLARK